MEREKLLKLLTEIDEEISSLKSFEGALLDSLRLMPEHLKRGTVTLVRETTTKLKLKILGDRIKTEEIEMPDFVIYELRDIILKEIVRLEKRAISLLNIEKED